MDPRGLVLDICPDVRIEADRPDLNRELSFPDRVVLPPLVGEREAAQNVQLSFVRSLSQLPGQRALRGSVAVAPILDQDRARSFADDRSEVPQFTAFETNGLKPLIAGGQRDIILGCRDDIAYKQVHLGNG